MGLSFVAIDFETANSYRGSPCAVGLARVEDGQVVATRKWLMRPPAGYDDFDGFNMLLHGITPRMVADEPRFKERLPDILAFIGDLPVVAHSAAFDMGVLREACDFSGVPWPTLSYACSLVLARQTYSLLSYSLPWVAEAAGIDLEGHHDPEADAVAAARIFCDIAARREADSVEDTLTHAHCDLGHLTPDDWSRCYHMQPGESGYLLPSPNPDADPSHPFYGREMVFTGALATMTRARAFEIAAEHGATPAPGVTKHTNILVVGFQDARKLSPGATLSKKAQKASDLRAKGQPIEVMPEQDFFQLLEDPKDRRRDAFVRSPGPATTNPGGRGRSSPHGAIAPASVVPATLDPSWPTLPPRREVRLSTSEINALPFEATACPTCGANVERPPKGRKKCTACGIYMFVVVIDKSRRHLVTEADMQRYEYIQYTREEKEQEDADREWRSAVKAAGVLIARDEDEAESADVVGVLHYQQDLAALTAALRALPDGSYPETVALLVREPNNPDDQSAVKVLIHGRVVGYLSRGHAEATQSWLEQQERSGRPVYVVATIGGGRDAGGYLTPISIALENLPESIFD